MKFFGAEPVWDVLAGRREEVYAEFVGVNEHTRAGPSDSARGRKPKLQPGTLLLPFPSAPEPIQSLGGVPLQL